MTKDLVSIITPAYNNAATLGETATSVMAQTYPHIEWIVVDNGSADGTKEVLASIASHPQVKVVSLPENVGVSGGRNAGLEVATGSFLCFLDADDLLPSDSIERRMHVMQTRPDVHFVDGAVRRIDEDGTEVMIKRPNFEGQPFDELLSLSGNCFIGITWLVRKVDDQEYRFEEGLTHGEDLLFFLSIAHRGVYTAVDEVVYDYRMRSGSAMHNLSGLEQGYRGLEERLRTWKNVDEAQRQAFSKRWRSIMSKSYLMAGKPWNALTVRWA